MQLATKLWVRVPAAAKFFSISKFNQGIANGAKVGLKLGLASMLQNNTSALLKNPPVLALPVQIP